jgi:REP element-mobilizing transposase RayT
MPFWRTYYHVVWATRDRRPDIEPRFEERMFGEVLSAAQRLGATVHAISGTADHVHLVASIPPTISVSAFVGQLKGGASHFVNRECAPDVPLVWERGYGLFTLGPGQLPRVVAYVRGQKEHHAQGTVSPAMERTEDR